MILRTLDESGDYVYWVVIDDKRVSSHATYGEAERALFAITGFSRTEW